MTIQVTNKPIVIPQAILKQAGIKPGDLVEFTASPGIVTVRKAAATSQRR
jgi:bifunctional DNA-binding transcriptional regulator/antitoxin component of YhaV-PrlF toxin-antitoxin module